MRCVAFAFVAFLCVAAEDANERRGLTIPVDYLQFWSTGYLTAHGENPYDSARLFELQKTINPDLPWPIISWHPPFALLLSIPFGLLPVPVGYLIWIGLQTAIVFLSAALLWKSGGGTAETQRIAFLLALLFGPTLIVIMCAQVTPTCLLGVAGFAAAARAGKPKLAGAAVALTALKPHLLCVFGLILLLDATRSRFSRVAVLTGCGVLLGASLIVTAVNPQVPGWYADVLLGRPATPMPYKPADVPSPTMGSFLREYVATGECLSARQRRPQERDDLPTRRTVVPGSFAVQLIPFAVLATVSVGVWFVHRKRWDWPTAIPWLVLASMASSPYGAWTFDLVLLLAVAIPTAARLSIQEGNHLAKCLAILWYILISGGMFVSLRFTGHIAEQDFVVVVPLAAVGLALAQWAAATGENRTMAPTSSPNGESQ